VSDLTFAPPSITFDTTSAPRWSPLTRLAFRFAFTYFSIFALCCGNATLWEVIPFHIGEFIQAYLAWPFSHAGQWIAQHPLHLTGVSAHLHPTGSGDTVIDWLAAAVMLSLALLITIIWTSLAELRPAPRKSLAYPRLLFWFSLLLRLTLGVAMLNYGLDKAFPLQMGPPLLATLNSPLGNTSPMTMLWTLIGLNPIYEIICGLAEISAGVLILFRRTALLGTLLTAFLTTNIVLYNFCFDVPVKLYALHLLLMSLVLLAPSMQLLFHFFILHRPTFPRERWLSPARWTFHNLGLSLRLETLITATVLVLFLTLAAFQIAPVTLAMVHSEAHPGPLTGQWHLTSATTLANGQPIPTPYLTGDGLPLSDIFLEPSGRAMLRDTDSVLWRARAAFDDKKHTVRISAIGHPDPILYAITQPDPNHLILTPAPTPNPKSTSPKPSPTPAPDPTLALTRVPLPTHYPLLDRGFHFINEWGLER
jgi:hypothetical protein